MPKDSKIVDLIVESNFRYFSNIVILSAKIVMIKNMNSVIKPTQAVLSFSRQKGQNGGRIHLRLSEKLNSA